MKKNRGKKRKLNDFRRKLKEHTSSFPTQDYEGSGYWHLHMPCCSTFIDETKLPTRLRKECVIEILKATERLHSLQPTNIEARVICTLSWPELSGSQIIVFFGEEYFGRFFNRHSPEQKWVKKEINWLKNTFGIEVPKQLDQVVYKETIKDQDIDFEQDLIFIGNFKNANIESGE